MKDLSSVLHLYIGCEVRALNPFFEKETYTEGYLTGIHGEYGPEIQLITNGNAEESPEYPGIENVKLVVSRLSDMTEEDAVQIAIIMYGDPDSVKWKLEDTSKHYFTVRRKYYTQFFTIDKAGGDIDRYDVDGSGKISELQATGHHHLVTIYLLSKGYWLFSESAFDDGLILDKKTL